VIEKAREAALPKVTDCKAGLNGLIIRLNLPRRLKPEYTLYPVAVLFLFIS
jgi:hypothetical protein